MGVSLTIDNVDRSCQVFTSPQLARAIVFALGGDPAARWLEPSAGDGAFVRALNDYGVPSGNVLAIDIDHRLAGSHPSLVAGVDFLQWYRGESQQFDFIVGNPPYVAISRLSALARRTALAVPGLATIPAPTPSTNVWYAFLLAAMHRLAKGGAMAWVLPAAWDYASYAKDMRSELPRLFGDVLEFRSRRPLFGGVLDGSVVVLARGFGQGPGLLERHVVADVPAMLSALSAVPPPPQARRSRVGQSAGCGATWRMGDLMSVSCGGVTGDVKYFLLTETARIQHSLPIASLVPVLSRAHHLTAARVSQVEWRRLREHDERVWLFRPPQRMMRHRAVQAYLNRSLEEGGCDRNRYKIRNRQPWFLTPLPAPADAFLSGMSLQGPWLAFRHMSRLTVTNTLYVVRFSKRVSRARRHALALSMLSTPARENFKAAGRLYADGLLKYEPGDLLDVTVPAPKRENGAFDVYERAVALLVSGESAAAEALANDFIFSG